jgi:hypothetical protein
VCQQSGRQKDGRDTRAGFPQHYRCTTCGCIWTTTIVAPGEIRQRVIAGYASE